MWDSSVVIGVKGTALGDTLDNDLTWDLSGSFGRNHADFFIFNTVNASLGPDTPTHFDPGDYIQTDYNLNFDVTYPLNDTVFLASGLEYRDEGFEIIEGERESHQIGPLAAQGFTAASNGFRGSAQLRQASGTVTTLPPIWKLKSDRLIRSCSRWLCAVNNLRFSVAP